MGDIRVGTSGWSYPSWVGTLYPDRTPASRMLSTYAQIFTAVEAHSTHRRLPTAATVERWADSVPPGFHFVAKVHAGITHRRATDGLPERIGVFFDALGALGPRLGPVLFVLPHHQPDLDRLDALLSALAGRSDQAIFELAPGWRVPEVAERLAAARASLAVVDREDDPGLDRPLDSSIAYVRLRRPTYTDAELATWADRLQVAASDGDRPVYAFVKHDEGGDGPRYARELVKRLGER